MSPPPPPPPPLLLLLLLLSLLASPGCHGDAGAGTVWPMPASMRTGARQLLLTDDTRFLVEQPACLLLQAAAARARRHSQRAAVWLSPKRPSPTSAAGVGPDAEFDDRLGAELLRYGSDKSAALRQRQQLPQPLRSVVVRVKAECNESLGRKLYPSVAMDESYSISFSSNDAEIVSAEVWGALHGLETLSQLFVRYPDSTIRVNATWITDRPRFAHRGTLLDTSRHFLPVSSIMQHLDAMAYNKINVFHWHIVDDQSFPYESYTFPNLSAKGAFSPYHVYSQQDVQDVVEAARRRGIRVVAELDTPGHTLSWGAGQPGLLTACCDASGRPNGQFGPVDPTNESNYAFLRRLFQEVAVVFPDAFVHLGGDEVCFDCWNSSRSIRDFMRRRGLGQNYSLLEDYYANRLLKLLPKRLQPIVWQEMLDNGVQLPPSTVVHVWKPDHFAEELAAATAAGHRALLSSCWYLDYFGNADWRKFYACEPLAFNGTERQRRLLLGGEACLWGEFVDAVNVVSRFWPRASAVAERLWSNLTTWSADAALPRLAAQHCRMLYRGIGVRPVERLMRCDNGPL